MADQNTTPELSNSSNSGSKRKHGGDGIRKRVSQACDQCRKKKLKCDGVRPTCSTCVSLDRQCLYGDAVRKRGLPEGYVRGLEKLLGLFLAEAGSLERVTMLFESALTDESAKADLIWKWTGGGAEFGETMPEIWRNSNLCKDLEYLLPLLDAGDNKGHEAKKSRLEPHSVDYGRGVDRQTKSSLQLPLSKVAEDLFSIYFNYTHCWLPIIGKDEMLAAYYQTLELSESSLGSGEHASLWAVLAYAEFQRSPTLRESNGVAYIEQSPMAESYYDKARGLIPSEGFDLDIGHVQALLVLSLIKLAMGQVRTSWLLVGQAVNIAIDIGINNTPSSMTGSFIGRPKHVFLGCFYLDTLFAACLRRLPRLRKEDALSVGLLAQNGLEEWGHLDLVGHKVGGRPGASRSLSIFNHLVRLVCVLNDFAHDKGPGESQEERLDYTRATLDNWQRLLPNYCSLKAGLNKVSPTVSIPHQLNLNITFLICKAIQERKCNTNPEWLLEEVRGLRKIAKAPHSQSEPGSIVFLPAFCLMVGMGLDNIYSSEHQYSTARTSLHPRPAAIGDELTGDTITNPDVNIASSVKTRFDSSVDYMTSHSLGNAMAVGGQNLPQGNTFHSNDARTPISPANLNVQNGSPLSMATMASLNDHMSMEGIVEGTPALFTKHPDVYSAAGDLCYLARSSRTSNVPQMGQEEKSGMGNFPTGFAIPDPVPSINEELALDSVLQNMAGDDDYFFELSNLDHL
jgi:hypothetical protein